MKFKSKYDSALSDFLDTVQEAKGDVYLKSVYGDVYNLKSCLSKYVGIKALLGEHGDELELFCAKKEDEPLFYDFFYHHQEVL